MGESFDYVVVGAGSAGATLAARLSERADRRVLLIEAGGRDWSPLIHVPGFLEYLIDSRDLNWRYVGDPDPSLNGRELIWAAGRVLGGSSSINGMVYGRGLPADYDRWVAAGAAGWGWNDLLPYFRRLERWKGPPHPDRGLCGPIEVRRFEDINAGCAEVMEALVGLGVPAVEDYGVGLAEGVGLTQATQRRGWRHSVASAYLQPARRRKNLTVITGALVESLIFERGRCLGVRLRRGRHVVHVRAERETILSAGAIASPKILMLSGVGPADELRGHGVGVIHDLPGVGANLNDHVNIKLSAFIDHPTYNTQRKGLSALRHGLDFLARGSGPVSSPANHAQAFVRTDPSAKSADVQLQVMALGFGAPAEMDKNGITVVVSPCHPRARGRIRLRSADPGAPPHIQMTLLDDEADIGALLRGCRLAYAALERGPGRRSGGRIYAPAPSSGGGPPSDAEWLGFFRETAALNWHPTSTCSMGAGRLDVVDTQLRVHGLERLSVVDASVMPSVTSANTNVPVIAIAERAAELIASRTA